MSVLTGASVALAPTASAVGSSACEWSVDRNAVVSSGSANLRTGPSTAYTSKGMLYKGDTFRAVCMASQGSYNWYYAKLNRKSKSGLASGTTGWIRTDLASWA
ncbi:SH3 domain-containing protein [Streptomyces canus]|uniref:SH3 domain-containing protein n=1 Tax=Streptomyces canus TaxID=58343 RepID=UPI0033C6D883